MNHFRDKGINRIGNLLVPNNNYVKFEVIFTVFKRKTKKYIFNREEEPVLAKNPDPGLCTSNEGRFLKAFFFRYF